MSSRLGVRARFTLLYGMAIILTVMLVSGGIYFFVRQALMGQIENHLDKYHATISAYLKSDPNELTKMAERGPINLFSIQEGSRQQISSRNWDREGLDEMLAAQGTQEQSHFSFRTSDGRRYRALIQTVLIDTISYRIAVAHDEAPVRKTLQMLALIILFIVPLAIILSLGIGYAIAGRVLAPIAIIAHKAEEIGAENLSARLPVDDSIDEFSRLAKVFNQTFTRIEDSFERLRRFTADASHELRTPLAAIRSIGETALHGADHQTDFREAIGSILEESDRLRLLIDDLLQLSRVESGKILPCRVAVDLAELARETVDFLNVLAEDKHQTIKIIASGAVIVPLDRASVRQALTNLLDNAIKYSSAGSNISITVGATSHDEAFVEITDCGMGIPEQDIPHIFDRFYRVDKGRSREMGGTGLGLSIVALAVKNNGGRIEVESEIDQGSIFRVFFPKSLVFCIGIPIQRR